MKEKEIVESWDQAVCWGDRCWWDLESALEEIYGDATQKADGTWDIPDYLDCKTREPLQYDVCHMLEHMLNCLNDNNHNPYGDYPSEFVVLTERTQLEQTLQPLIDSFLEHSVLYRKFQDTQKHIRVREELLERLGEDDDEAEIATKTHL